MADFESKLKRYISSSDFRKYVAKMLKIKDADWIEEIRLFHVDFEGWASFLVYADTARRRKGFTYHAMKDFRFSVKFDLNDCLPIEFKRA